MAGPGARGGEGGCGTVDGGGGEDTGGGGDSTGKGGGSTTGCMSIRD